MVLRAHFKFMVVYFSPNISLCLDENVGQVVLLNLGLDFFIASVLGRKKVKGVMMDQGMQAG